jgi:hypothetical protein
MNSMPSHRQQTGRIRSLHCPPMMIIFGALKTLDKFPYNVLLRYGKLSDINRNYISLEFSVADYLILKICPL